jgi:hypothetical protein
MVTEVAVDVNSDHGNIENSQENANISDLEMDAIKTFRVMMWRKLSRLRNGHLKRNTVGRILWTVLVTLLFFAMVNNI